MPKKKSTRLVVAVMVILLASLSRAQPTCRDEDAQVLILGAGASGIAAARELHDNGLTDFLILEGRPEIGGRMRAVDFAGVKVEVGANWITGVDLTNSSKFRTNPLWVLKQATNLSTIHSDYGSTVVYDVHGKNVTAHLPHKKVEHVYGQLANLIKKMKAAGDKDVTVREALTKFHWTPSPAHPLENYLDWYSFDYNEATPPDNVSLFAWRADNTDVDFGTSDFFVTDQRGFAYLLEYLGEPFLNAKVLHTDATVTSIEYSDQCVCAYVMEQGSSKRYCGKYGIVTFSIGVLQSKTVNFSPKLPEWKVEAINKYELPLFLKVFILFNETFWDDNVQYLGRAVSNRENYTLFLPMGQLFESRPHLLLAILTGNTARQTTAQDTEITKLHIYQAMRSIYGNFRAEIVDILVPDWESNEFYHGSYSDPKVGVTTETYTKLADPVGNLFFTGEATSEHYYGYVHGAYFAGIHTANMILEHMEGIWKQRTNATRERPG